MDPVKTPLPQLALSALTILAMHTVCAIPLFSPHSEADADAAAEAAAKVKTTVVTGTPTHPVATLPTPDPLSTVLNAALSAIVVVCVVSGLYWAARRLTNGRHPPAPVLAVAAALSALSGCWAPKAPGTHLSISPWTRTVRFDDTKDNRVLVEGLDIDAHNGSAHLDRLEIDNRASSVIEMQVQQMIAHAEQMRVANEGIRLALSGIAEIVARLTALLPPPKPAPPAEDPTGAKPHEPVRLPM